MSLFKNRKVLLFSLIFVALLFGALIGATATLKTPIRYTPLIEPTIKNISNTSFQELFAQNREKYIFIDVRDAATYEQGHPAGSINIPLGQLYTERLKLPKTGKQIVLICGGSSASGVGFSYLQHYGFRNIERIPGGYREWVSAGLPTETGTTSPNL